LARRAHELSESNFSSRVEKLSGTFHDKSILGGVRALA
jgi:hypothetical protein